MAITAQEAKQLLGQQPEGGNVKSSISPDEARQLLSQNQGQQQDFSLYDHQQA